MNDKDYMFQKEQRSEKVRKILDEIPRSLVLCGEAILLIIAILLILAVYFFPDINSIATRY